MNFSTYPIIYNPSYQRDHNEQPIYEIDFLYSKDSESDNTIAEITFRLIKVGICSPTQGLQTLMGLGACSS